MVYSSFLSARIQININKAIEVVGWVEELDNVKYKCVTNGFTKEGCLVDNPDSEKKETVYNGDILNCEGDYIVKNGVLLCHKDSIIGKYHFRKVS